MQILTYTLYQVVGYLAYVFKERNTKRRLRWIEREQLKFVYSHL